MNSTLTYKKNKYKFLDIKIIKTKTFICTYNNYSYKYNFNTINYHNNLNLHKYTNFTILKCYYSNNYKTKIYNSSFFLLYTQTKKHKNYKMNYVTQKLLILSFINKLLTTLKKNIMNYYKFSTTFILLLLYIIPIKNFNEHYK